MLDRSQIHQSLTRPSFLLCPAARPSRAFAAVQPSRRQAVRQGKMIARADASEPSAETDKPEPKQQNASFDESQASELRQAAQQAQQSSRKRRQADSTDWFASTLTRRFGLAGGLAWLGFLTFGVVSEQIKTRLEVASDERGTRDVEDAKEVTLPSGVRYTDLRIGGGQRAAPGLLLVLQMKLKANGDLLQDSSSSKPLVVFGGRRPLTGGLTLGAEEALMTMKAGGKRRIFVPAARGFGSEGGVLRPTEHVPDKSGVIPPNADLEYEIELVRVSVPPS